MWVRTIFCSGDFLPLPPDPTPFFPTSCVRPRVAPQSFELFTPGVCCCCCCCCLESWPTIPKRDWNFINTQIFHVLFLMISFLTNWTALVYKFHNLRVITTMYFTLATLATLLCQFCIFFCFLFFLKRFLKHIPNTDGIAAPLMGSNSLKGSDEKATHCMFLIFGLIFGGSRCRCFAV